MLIKLFNPFVQIKCFLVKVNWWTIQNNVVELLLEVLAMSLG